MCNKSKVKGDTFEYNILFKTFESKNIQTVINSLQPSFADIVLRTLEANFNENWKTPQGPTIIFMPCSSEQSYYNRFSTLARSLSKRYNYNTAIDAIQYTDTRQSKHRSQNRDAIESSSNIVISPKIIGKEVIIIDDVITTGSSLHQFAKELRTYGVTIKAAVFLAQTAKYPTDKELYRHTRKTIRHRTDKILLSNQQLLLI